MMPHDHAPTHAFRFPQRVAQLLVDLKPPALENALDIGCAVGGTALELAKTFQHVDASDISKSFIDAAKRIQKGESIPFRIRVEGDVYQDAVAKCDRVLDNVNFFVADACLVEDPPAPRDECKYDAVVLANLLCRLPDPVVCLNWLPHLVKEGGVVLIVTPFTWLEEYTPKKNWIGGTEGGQSSIDDLTGHMMTRGFVKIHDEEMPLLIREHQRKYQYIISRATGWRNVKIYPAPPSMA
jgi:putative 4-mercaptohistidine N1-methyltranferase